MTKTAEDLLKKRYEAFKQGDIDFIIQSHHPDTREQLDRNSLRSWSERSVWRGLDIEDVDEGDERALIRFTVHFDRKNETLHQTELAEFRKVDGEWYYYDSEFPSQPPQKREEPKLGRNDPCHCGSGKKFKKCHGSA